MVMAKRMVERRRAVRLTQGYIARAVGVSIATVRRWEKGCGCPDGMALKMLCTILGCGFWYLVGASDIPHGLGALSADEIALITDYRAAGADAKAMVAACLEDTRQIAELLGAFARGGGKPKG